MTPTTAILTTLFVPGSAHVLLGRPVRGGVAFVTTVGMFLVGYAIVGTHIWYFSLMSPSGFFGTLFHALPLPMLPESLNLGPTMVASWLRDTTSVEAMRIERMPVEWGHLGLLLTALSGIANCLWMADAHWLAGGKSGNARISPPAAAALSWLIPGAGHVAVGQRDKGWLLGAAVLIMFAAGLGFSMGHGVDRVLQSAWFDGQVLCGIGVIFGSLVTAPLVYDTPPAHYDLGIMLCTVAGFMNLLVMCNAYTVAEDGANSIVVPHGEVTS